MRLGLTGHRAGTNQNSGLGFGRTGIRFIVKLFKMKPNYLFEIGKPVYQTTERLNQPLKIAKTNCKSEERAAESCASAPQKGQGASGSKHYDRPTGCGRSFSFSLTLRHRLFRRAFSFGRFCPFRFGRRSGLTSTHRFGFG